MILCDTSHFHHILWSKTTFSRPISYFHTRLSPITYSTLPISLIPPLIYPQSNHSSHWSFYLTLLDPHPEACYVERKEKRIYSLSYIGGINCRKGSDDCGCDLAVAIGITDVCDDCFEVWALKFGMVWRKRKEVINWGPRVSRNPQREMLTNRKWGEERVECEWRLRLMTWSSTHE